MLPLPLADPGIPDTSSPGRFVLWCARKQTRTLVAGSAFGIVWMVSQAMIPLALGASLGAVVRRDKGQIVVWAMVVLGLGLLQAAAGILRHRRAVASFLICATRVQQLVARRAVLLGGALARRVAAGEVANIGASDVERVGDALDVVARFAGGVVSYAVVAVVLLVVSPPLGAIVVLGVPVAVLAIAPVLKPFERRQTFERDRRTDASSIASDTVTGLRVLRGLGGEEVFGARYERASQAVAAASMRSANFQAILDGAQVILPGAIVVAVTWVGAHLAVEGRVSPGRLVAFYASAVFLVLPMQTFVEAASRWTAAVVAARRILGVLALEPDPRGDVVADARRQVARASAGRSWAGRAPATKRSALTPALRDADAPVFAERPVRLPDPSRDSLVDEVTGVEVEPGSLTAIVPSTPEDGTALLERFARWSDPGSGGVSWGGLPVGDLPLDWYRRHVVMLERSPFHLKGVLREALDLSDEPVRPDVLFRALEAAQAVDIVRSLPRGLDTELPEHWRSLSGGQRQRISVVQVFLKEADVLLLDDPTSAVDAHTEAAIAVGVAGVRSGRTTVVTTTSPLVTERADRVVLLEGTVRRAGMHEELLDDPMYDALVLRGLTGLGRTT